MQFVSYAQNGEDVLLNRVFAETTDGFYVDIGAYDPVEGSVTKAFSDRGWTGINIEPGTVFDRLAAARPRDINLRMAVLDRAGTASFIQDSTDAGMSHVILEPDGPNGGDYEVPCDTLNSIVETHAPGRTIDFLKIDAEGSEGAIVSSTDWHIIRPTVLVIEATHSWSNELVNADWEPVLLTYGYRRVWFDGINCFYLPHERDDLLRCFDLPINVLDNWVLFDASRAGLESERASLDAALASTRAHLQAAEAQAEATKFRLSRTRAQLEAAHSQLDGTNAKLRVTIARLESTDTQLEAARLRLEASKSQLDATDAQLEVARAQLSLEREQRGRLDLALTECTAELATESERSTRLAARAILLYRLVRELRWPDGPKALRVVLPIARFLRSIARTRVPALLSGEIDLMVEADRRMDDTPMSSPPDVVVRRPRAKATAKRIVLGLYYPVRPMARPIAWRIRTFMTGDIKASTGEIKASTGDIKASTGDIKAMTGDIKAMTGDIKADLLRVEANLNALTAAVSSAVSAQQKVTSNEPIPVTAGSEIRELARLVETALLTFALDRHPHRD